jgi:UV DNA damage endonuclease
MKLRPEIQKRITLENDDKTFTALETVEIAERVGVPMVLDIHHHQVNNDGEEAVQLWPRIQKTWLLNTVNSDQTVGAAPTLPPKIHASSPKSEKEPRSHADYIEANPLLAFLRDIAAVTPNLDIMIEAKMKDQALLQLMEECKRHKDVTPLSQASFEI